MTLSQIREDSRSITSPRRLLKMRKVSSNYVGLMWMPAGSVRLQVAVDVISDAVLGARRRACSGAHCDALEAVHAVGGDVVDEGAAVAHAGVALGVGVADPRADPRSVAEVGVCHRVRHRASGQTAGRHRQVKDIVREFQGLADLGV